MFVCFIMLFCFDCDPSVLVTHSMRGEIWLSSAWQLDIWYVTLQTQKWVKDKKGNFIVLGERTGLMRLCFYNLSYLSLFFGQSCFFLSYWMSMCPFIHDKSFFHYNRYKFISLCFRLHLHYADLNLRGINRATFQPGILNNPASKQPWDGAAWKRCCPCFILKTPALRLTVDWQKWRCLEFVHTLKWKFKSEDHN